MGKIKKDVLKAFKDWEATIPDYILKITPEEAYMDGFNLGYQCKLCEIGNRILNITPTLCLKEN